MNKEQEEQINELQKILNDLHSCSVISYSVYSDLFDLAENYISKEEAKVNERKIKQKIYNDLMKIADDGEIEDLRVHVEDYFKD